MVLVRGSGIFAYSYTSLRILQNIEHKGTKVKLGLLYVKFTGRPSFFPFKKVSLRSRARFILGHQDSENSQWDSWVTGMLGVSGSSPACWQSLLPPAWSLHFGSSLPTKDPSRSISPCRISPGRS